MRVIGVTGGVGAGKSTVLSMLKELCNCEIVMADDIAKDMMEPDGGLYQELIRIFGDKAYENGVLNRKYIAEQMYNNDSLKREWTAIVHPAVNSRIFSIIDDAKKTQKVDYVFIEAALLIENGYDRICDEIWYVFADAGTRIERLQKQRGYTPEKTGAIMDSQLSDDIFRSKSQFVIDTGHDIESTYNILKNKLSEY